MSDLIGAVGRSCQLRIYLADGIAKFNCVITA